MFKWIVLNRFYLTVANAFSITAVNEFKKDDILYLKTKNYMFILTEKNSKIKNIQINDKEYNNFLDLFYNIKTKITKNTKKYDNYTIIEKSEIKTIKYKIDYPSQHQIDESKS